MLTRLLTVNPECLEERKYSRIVKTLNDGGVIVYPTDTFYGIGADCFAAAAVRRIYEIKKRDPSRPLLLVIADVDMAGRVASVLPPIFLELASRFWPGPLTLTLKASNAVPREVLGEGDSIAVRIPDLPWLRALISQAGYPLVATSANISGEREISTADEALALFRGKVDMIVDGGRTPGIRPSTVLDLTHDKPRLVREGALPRAALERYL
jgi:L-threonylcarbamoyladenylate synthase